MTPQQLRRKVARLNPVQPITAWFEAALAERKSRKRDPWYGSQKEHWLGWLSEYDGPGYYGRSSWDVSAETVYNRVVNPSMVLWLGEAAGVSKSVIEAAARDALAGKPSMAAQSGGIRHVVTWPMIADRL